MEMIEKRKTALMFSIDSGSERVVDRLLSLGVDVPEHTGNFYITVNGVPLCLLDCLFSGDVLHDPGCEYTFLPEAVEQRQTVKAAFPGAIVGVKTGRCPIACSKTKAA